MRIVTRPDFDGVVCAVLLRKAENIRTQICWIEPNDIQSGRFKVQKGDILANLPYSKDCALWFDHHVSNKPDTSFNGAFEIAPSAAAVVYTYYQNKGSLDNRYDELIHHTDIIDAAQLNMDQVRFPEKYPYILLSMTLKNEGKKEGHYWNRLVDLLADPNIDAIMEDREVKKRCAMVIEENAEWEGHLRQHTRIENGIAITDFRTLKKVPSGNRFLPYVIFPDTIASVKIRFGRPDRSSVQISVGKSIFNKKCNVNIGRLLSGFGGGGHDGAGGCTLSSENADTDIERILNVMFENRPVN